MMIPGDSACMKLQREHIYNIEIISHVRLNKKTSKCQEDCSLK